MIRTRRLLAAAATALTATLAIAACGPTDANQAEGPEDQPVAGGTATILLYNEPRSLDPASVSNAWATSAALGNALYGTLLINDAETGEIEYRMAESFTTADDGETFELTLRKGLTFSDGSPLDAAAVKFNWDRLKDPATASTSIRTAALISSTTVLDPRTLRVTLRTPIPSYAHGIITSSLNWIASPEALRAGQQAFDANPVGAGPFTVQSWTRNDKLELAKNPRYWDAPKPYLDTLTMRAVPDSTQRLNAVIGGSADLAAENHPAHLATATESELSVETMALNGGQGLVMNTRRAPFDDPRARRAMAAALDLNALNLSVYEGEASIARTLFTKSSPFYADIPLVEHDKRTAQRLFDELAAEGKPVSFTFTTYVASEAKLLAESVQAQLSAFRNVKATVRTVDFAEASKFYAEHDFDMIISTVLQVDPEPILWSVFHGESPANMSGIDDARLNDALQTGRTATTVAERKAAYDVVQERLAALVPMIINVRVTPGSVATKDISGVEHYGLGSLLPERLWTAQ